MPILSKQRENYLLIQFHNVKFTITRRYSYSPVPVWLDGVTEAISHESKQKPKYPLN